MTPKEKAIDLVSKFFNNDLKNITTFELAEIEAKNCALIAVDEIDLIIQKFTPSDDEYCYLQELEYWQEVKEEINKL